MQNTPPRPVAPREAEDVLSAWIGLEVLSPQTFGEPSDLDPRCVVSSWPRSDEDGPVVPSDPPPSYAHVPLGEVELPRAFAALRERFGADEEARPPKGRVLLASVATGADGAPIRGSLAIGSFAFAVAASLGGTRRRPSEWPEVEREAQRALGEVLWPDDAAAPPGGEEGERPNRAVLTRGRVSACRDHLRALFGLPEAFVRPPRFLLLRPEGGNASGERDDPAPLILNSFFLDDLVAARAEARDGTLAPTVSRYLGGREPGGVPDLVEDEEAVRALVRPHRFPAASWPAPGGFPLALLQQAAVNAAAAAEPGDVIAVNGPPGTGKTTLLRDVIAVAVERRAAAMCAFDDPNDALTPTGVTVGAGRRRHETLYALDPALHGHGVLVASSNNRAVENVSRELPRTDAVRDGTASHLATTATGLAGEASWGLVAGVLGRRANASAFAERFWWDPDTGLRAYLRLAGGAPMPLIRVGEDGSPQQRPPRAITEQSPPRGRREAMSAWQAAREAFAARKEAVRARLDVIERARQLVLGADTAIGRAADAQAEAARWRRAVSERSLLRGLSARWRAFLAERLAKRLVAVADAARADAEDARGRLGAGVLDATWASTPHEERQLTAPWLDEAARRERWSLFEASLAVHRAFLGAAAARMSANLDLASALLKGRALPPGAAERHADLWASLWCAVPVLSTTFASTGRLLSSLGEGDIGWLLIDEAGQAPPQAAIGALRRARRVVVVGDPLQVEPVTTLPRALQTAITKEHGLDPSVWALDASVQTLADAASPYGARYGERRVGMPLLVHRRCEAPMVGISNEAAYGGLMVPAAPTRAAGPVGAALGESRWFDVVTQAPGRWSEGEGAFAVRLLRRMAREGVTDPDLFLVTPFRDVQFGLRRALRREADLCRALGIDPRTWPEDRIGTVHTVQGREAEAVIFVLGAPGEGAAGARRWAAGQPNIVNVAVTRARQRLYVVGRADAWAGIGAARFMAWQLRVVPVSPGRGEG